MVKVSWFKNRLKKMKLVLLNHGQELFRNDDYSWLSFRLVLVGKPVGQQRQHFHGTPLE